MYVEGEGEPGGRDRERRGRGRERRGNEGSGTESDHRRCGYRSPLPRSGLVQRLAVVLRVAPPAAARSAGAGGATRQHQRLVGPHG